MVGGYLARASAALLFLVAAVGAGTAQAQNYEGPGLLRFGVFAQGAFVDFDIREIPFGSATTLDHGTSNLDAAGAGVSFGYDHRIWPGVVLGIEGDLSLEHASAAAAGHQFRQDFLLTVRGRLGVYAHQSWLLYATAGYAAMGVEYKGTTTITTNLAADKIDATLSGWTAGVGTELDMPRFILFAEYLYTDVGTWGLVNSTGDQYIADVVGHFVRAGVKFKIGHEYRPGEPILPP